MYHFIDFGGKESAPVLHFAHANGFPPESYQELLGPLCHSYHVVSFRLRPLWDNPPLPELNHWQEIADDLIRDLDSTPHLTPVIGLGHSLGAVATLLAARQRPDLFLGVVALDPVLFPRWFVWAFTIGPDWLPRPEIPLIKSTLRRRRQWGSREEAFERFRSKSTFAKWSDTALHAYINSVTRESETGIELIYTPEWEAAIYRSSMNTNRGWWRWLQDINVPVIVIRGAESDTFRAGSVKRWQHSRPDFTLHEIPNGGHLFPIEFPQKTADCIVDSLKSLNINHD